MNFDNTLFRCSSLGHIMTDPRSGNDLSETAKTHLIDVYVSNRYGRQTDITTKYMEKGLMVEEDSITLYSRIKKNFFKKNEEHLNNQWIKGTPDIFTGKTIQEAETITDIKSSWDIFTFMRTISKDVNKLYYWQLQGYMDLTGAKSATLAYCLVDTPDQLVSDEKRKLMWKMGVATEENPLFIEACDELDKLMKYDDIPMEQRLIEFTIERNDVDIMKMHSRVEKCRVWLNEFEATRYPELLKATA